MDYEYLQHDLIRLIEFGKKYYLYFRGMSFHFFKRNEYFVAYKCKKCNIMMYRFNHSNKIHPYKNFYENLTCQEVQIKNLLE